MVADGQEILDAGAITRWANDFGIGLTLFHGWDQFVEQALFWSGLPKPVAASLAVDFIHQRLVKVEATPDAVEMWGSLAK